MKKVAISACLMGRECRYDALCNRNDTLLKMLDGYELIEFCPEDSAFGTPRPTMDLVEDGDSIKAISNKTDQDLSFAIEGYAKKFFDTHSDIELFIGKDRSPSCGVCSACVYDTNRDLQRLDGTGLMAKEAQDRGIEAYDAEVYMEMSR
jgi:uncharacterized protein YbbK (DUF523 family)